jgi:hypothetical protein
LLTTNINNFAVENASYAFKHMIISTNLDQAAKRRKNIIKYAYQYDRR